MFERLENRPLVLVDSIVHIKLAAEGMEDAGWGLHLFCWVPLPLVVPPFGDYNARAGKAESRLSARSAMIHTGDHRPCAILRFAPNLRRKSAAGQKAGLLGRCIFFVNKTHVGATEINFAKSEPKR